MNAAGSRSHFFIVKFSFYYAENRALAVSRIGRQRQSSSRPPKLCTTSNCRYATLIFSPHVTHLDDGPVGLVPSGRRFAHDLSPKRRCENQKRRFVFRRMWIDRSIVTESCSSIRSRTRRIVCGWKPVRVVHAAAAPGFTTHGARGSDARDANSSFDEKKNNRNNTFFNYTRKRTCLNDDKKLNTKNTKNLCCVCRCCTQCVRYTPPPTGVTVARAPSRQLCQHVSTGDLLLSPPKVLRRYCLFINYILCLIYYCK